VNVFLKVKYNLKVIYRTTCWFTQGSRSGCDAQPEPGQNSVNNCNTILMATEGSGGTGRKA
jgi:hypothetical protein